MLEDFFKRDLPPIEMGFFGCDGKYKGINNTPLAPLDRGEIVDLERMNFVAWYRGATVEEIAIARRNNAVKLDELKKKYAAEIELIDIVGRGTA